MMDIPVDTPDRNTPPEAAASSLTLSLARAEAIANLAVRLATLGPTLALLAGEAQSNADAQAEASQGLSRAAGHLASELTAAVGDLTAASVAVREATFEIVRLADQTRVLSINANIEAARAGTAGKSFMVVAQQVERLAIQTRDATQKIGARVSQIEGQVTRISQAVSAPAGTAASPAVTVAGVHRQVEDMAQVAGRQKSGSHTLHGKGEEANALAEGLLLLVGTLRLELHRTAEQRIRDFLPLLAAGVWEPASLHPLFTSWMEQHPSFELLYLTDARGTQVTGNVYRQGMALGVDDRTRGRDWAARPWFLEAKGNSGTCAISDIYRSEATGEYCFTVSVAVMDARGVLRGVLGADINFQTMVKARVG